MSSFGQRVISTGGRGVRAFAEAIPHAKHAGITVDWAAISAVSGDTTLDDGTIVLDGDKYIPAGRVMMRINDTDDGYTVGKYAPWTTGAADGREVATAAARGDCYILDETVIMSQEKSDHPAVYDGGVVYKTRVVGLTGNPSEAQIEAMFPMISFLQD